MAELTRDDLEQLRADIAALRHDMDQQFKAIDIHFAHVEAKLDAKPSVAVLYQAVVTLMFGIGAVVTSTVVVLKNVGVMG